MTQLKILVNNIHDVTHRATAETELNVYLKTGWKVHETHQHMDTDNGTLMLTTIIVKEMDEAEKPESNTQETTKQSGEKNPVLKTNQQNTVKESKEEEKIKEGNEESKETSTTSTEQPESKEEKTETPKGFKIKEKKVNAESSEKEKETKKTGENTSDEVEGFDPEEKKS